MSNRTLCDALRLVKDVAESRKMPSGIEANQPTADLHIAAAVTQQTTLAVLLDYE